VTPDDWLNLNAKFNTPFCSKFCLISKTWRWFFQILPVWDATAATTSDVTLMCWYLHIDSERVKIKFREWIEIYFLASQTFAKFPPHKVSILKYNIEINCLSLTGHFKGAFLPAFVRGCPAKYRQLTIASVVSNAAQQTFTVS